jgi:hypothetical protein
MLQNAPPLAVTVQAFGATAASTTGQTDQRGRFSTTATPTTASPWTGDVRACFDDTSLPHLSKVCPMRHVAGAVITTTVTTSTTTTTMLGASGAFLTSRHFEAYTYAHAQAYADPDSPPSQGVPKQQTDFVNSGLVAQASEPLRDPDHRLGTEIVRGSRHGLVDASPLGCDIGPLTSMNSGVIE